MKAYVGQVICNDQGKIMGKIARIDGDQLFFIPWETPVSFGNKKFYRSESGEELE